MITMEEMAVFNSIYKYIETRDRTTRTCIEKDEG